MKSEVVILGTRGSVPVSGKSFVRYGGSTTCIFLRIADQPIVVDAGTGMLELPGCLKPDDQRIPVLLSHMHIDHLLGFPMCCTVFESNRKIDIYAARRNGKNAEEQVRTFWAPPLWPVGPEVFPAEISFLNLQGGMRIGNVEIETMEGVHPNGVTVFRLTGDGKSVVVVTDCTLTEKLLPELTEFAKDCDLLLCDGQYSPKEWSGKENFGHNTWAAAAEFGTACGAKKVRIIHHDPKSTDDILDAAGAELAQIHKDCAFAYAGERLIL